MCRQLREMRKGVDDVHCCATHSRGVLKPGNSWSQQSVHHFIQGRSNEQLDSRWDSGDAGHRSWETHQNQITGTVKDCTLYEKVAEELAYVLFWNWHQYQWAKYSSDADVVRHCSRPTLWLTSRHMFMSTPVTAFLKRRNITPPFHIDKTADCSLYLAANVAHFLTKRGFCFSQRYKEHCGLSQSVCEPQKNPFNHKNYNINVKYWSTWQQ